MTRENPTTLVLAAWDANMAIASLEASSCVAAADIAAGYLLDACTRLRVLGDAPAAARFEKQAGEVFMSKLWSQGVAQRGMR